jgi:hypothetical protein
MSAHLRGEEIPMQYLKGSKSAALRAAVVGMLAGSLLLPAVTSAAADNSGTLVGTVTCGGQSASAPMRVSLEGTNLSVQSAGGKFELSGVPAAQMFTVDAVDSTDALIASRYDVAVSEGETLDIGVLDLPACPSAAAEAPAPQDQSMADAFQTDL